MENFMSIILSNTVYMIIAGVAIAIILFLLIKKLFKFFLFACILFIAFLAYIHYTGGSVKETIKDVKEEGREIINTNK
jgi:hypothetical protein